MARYHRGPHDSSGLGLRLLPLLPVHGHCCGALGLIFSQTSGQGFTSCDC